LQLDDVVVDVNRPHLRQGTWLLRCPPMIVLCITQICKGRFAPTEPIVPIAQVVCRLWYSDPCSSSNPLQIGLARRNVLR
jgi:hypothetical protein